MGPFPQGVFKTTDGGATWVDMSAGLPAGCLVGALAVDPGNTSNVYAGVVTPPDTGNFVVSTDGGSTWGAPAVLPHASQIHRIAVDPSNVIYLGADQGPVYVSTDGGATFSPDSLGLPPVACRDLALDPVTPGTLYAAAGTGGTATLGLFKKTAGSATWVQVDSGPFGHIAVDPSTPSTVYATNFDAGPVKSVDGGATWSPANGGLPANLLNPALTAVNDALAIDPSNPQTLYYGTMVGLFKTVTGGR
jgi:photosystem II stability/assembly factor-like uncharacterized protein